MKKGLKFAGIGCIGLIVLVIIVSIIGGGGSSFKEGLKEGFEEGMGQTTEKFKNQEVSEENIRSALKDLKDSSYAVMGVDEITKIEIYDNLGTKGDSEDEIVQVSFKPSGVWDEEHALKKASGTAVEVMRRLFVHSKITTVRVWTEGDFTDQYGQSSTENVVKVELKKETAEKIDWENFKDLVLLDPNKLFDIADEVYIYPALQK